VKKVILLREKTFATEETCGKKQIYMHFQYCEDQITILCVSDSIKPLLAIENGWLRLCYVCLPRLSVRSLFRSYSFVFILIGTIPSSISCVFFVVYFVYFAIAVYSTFLWGFTRFKNNNANVQSASAFMFYINLRFARSDGSGVSTWRKTSKINNYLLAGCSAFIIFASSTSISS